MHAFVMFPSMPLSRFRSPCLTPHRREEKCLRYILTSLNIQDGIISNAHMCTGTQGHKPPPPHTHTLGLKKLTLEFKRKIICMVNSSLPLSGRQKGRKKTAKCSKSKIFKGVELIVEQTLAAKVEK